MRRALRRVTYISFFILFFILAPLFISYGMGYRYNLSTGQIEKNGAFYVKSYPRNANIIIDGEGFSQKTPHQITSMRSGTYQLTVSKDKYELWQKELRVDSGQTTFAEDIVLFLQERPKTDLGTGSANYIINKNKNKYAYIDELNQLFITDVNEEKNFLLTKFAQDYTFIDWSEDDQKILLQSGLNYFIFNINQKNIEPVPLQAVSKMIWDNQNSNTLWYIQADKLKKYNPSVPANNTNNSPILVRPVADFDFSGDYLAVLYTDDSSLDQLKKDDLSLVQSISKLALGNLDFLHASASRAVFKIGSQLYIKDIRDELITIAVTITDIHDDRILLSNGHEIIIYNYKDQWQDLIDRSSQIVSELMWHPNGSYFLSEINDQTRITEIDGRSTRNFIDLIENPLKKLYLFNSKGDKLFVLSPEENYYLAIQ